MRFRTTTHKVLITMNKKISHKQLKQVLDYNPITGVFTWLISAGSNSVGKPAGCCEVSQDEVTKEYIVRVKSIAINKISYPAHRLAWFYIYGKWPIGKLRHKDGNKGNHAIKNLAEPFRFD